MADYNLPGWSYEQQQMDEPDVATAPVPTAAPGMVTIGQEDWRTGGRGPVPVPEGQGIRLIGGLPFKPEGPLPWWTIAYEQEKQKMAEEERMRQLVQSVPFEQQSKAIERARRLQGSLGFAADIKAGVPVVQALARNASDLYYNAPAAHASAFRGILGQQVRTPYNLGQTIPFEGGKVVVTGPGSGTTIMDEREMKQSQTLSHIEKRIELLQKEREDTRRGSPERTTIQSEIDDLNRRANALLRQKSAVAPAVPQAATSSNKEESRQRAREYISKYPSKAEAIRKRFRETFNEDV